MIDLSVLNEIITPAIAVARAYAADRTRLSEQEKSPGQFVSDADEALEDVIRQTLHERFGATHIIGEEQGGALDNAQTGWAIDPIDGTSNFLRGLPMWGVSIGFVHEGAFVAGAIALPDRGLTMAAARGAGVQVNGRPFRRPTAPLGGRLVALGENDFESGPTTDGRAEALRRQGYAVVRYRSASFSLVSAALGHLDGYVEHGCYIWDVAAAAVICREAGLAVDTAHLGDGRFAISALAAA